MAKIRIWLCVVFFLGLAAQALAKEVLENPQVKFYEANLAYKEGDFSKAVSLYEEIIKAGVEGGSIYYNLANSYFKSKDFGKAILNYERARLFIPRDSDLQANLAYALADSGVADRPESASWAQRVFSGYKHALTMREIAWIVFFLYFFVGLVIALGEVFVFLKPYRFGILSFLLVLIIFNSFALAGKLSNVSSRAIVLVQTSARFEPREQATVHFNLSSGEDVALERIEGDWSKIERFDGKLGWIENKAFEKVQVR